MNAQSHEEIFMEYYKEAGVIDMLCSAIIIFEKEYGTPPTRILITPGLKPRIAVELQRAGISAGMSVIYPMIISPGVFVHPNEELKKAEVSLVVTDGNNNIVF